MVILGRVCLTLAALAVGAFLPAAPARADFTLFSQNALHLGWQKKSDQSYVPDKYAYLKNIAGKQDIMLFQEVMNDDPKTKVPPAGYTAYLSASPKGMNRYFENYLALVNTQKVTVYCHVTLDRASYPTLIRPPDLLLVSSKASVNPTWIVNFHAIWGNSQKQRTDEATKIKALLSDLTKIAPSIWSKACPSNLKAVPRVIAAGDWNLEGPAMKTVWGATGDPATDTTLNRSGAYSSAYDHFVWSNGVTAKGAAAVFDPATFPVKPTYTLKDFRNRVSDHLGISITIGD